MPSPGPIDEFLNLDAQDMDFLNFSRNSSSSPASSINPLPPTPLQQQQSSVGTTAADTVDISNNELFQDFYRDFILPKANYSNPHPTLTDSHASTSTAEHLPSSSSSLPFSFGDLFAGYSIPNSADPLFAPLGGMPSYPLAIDPQLMATPALPSVHNPLLAQPLTPMSAPVKVQAPPSTASANTPSLKDMGSDSEEDSDEEEDLHPKVKATRGGKRASAVATGGIVKRTGPTSCVVRDPESNDPDDWRPTAEEYKKLSSKEKRQLRNKISARNFRVRRKEYITTLEGHIADRDRLIEAIREELGQSKLENSELRQEVDALKKAMLEGKAHPTGLPPPAPISDAVASATPAPLSSSKRRPGATSTPLAKPNINKDVSGAATSSSSKAFWGGAPVGTGGITPVHATLIPDMHFPSATASVLSGKSLSSRIGGGLQDNINPLMNLFPPSPPASPPTNNNNTPNIANSTLDALLRNAAASHWSQPQHPHQVFDAFSDNNPFTIKTLDGYRMQLWGKVAAAQHLAHQQHQQPSPPTSASSSSSSPSPSPQFVPLPLFNQASPLSSSLRPAFFTSHSKSFPSSPNLTATLSGKATGSHTPLRPSTPSPPSLPPTSTTSQQQREVQATAYVAAMASQSLVARMGAAFWDAFSGQSGPSPSGSKSWDADKVRKVLEGKAVVRVVDVDEPKESKTKASKLVSTATSPKLLPTLGLSTPKLGPSRPNVDSLEDCMKKMSLKEEPLGASDSDNCVAVCAGVFSNLRGTKSSATEAK